MDLLTIVPDFIKGTFGIIDKFVPDKAAAQQIKAQIAERADQLQSKVVDGQTAIIVAEANSGSWLSQNWRPLTMLVFVTIIANNYIVYPYASLFWNEAPKMTIPPDMWDLLKIGIGGYIFSRGAEKTAKNWKKK